MGGDEEGGGGEISAYVKAQKPNTLFLLIDWKFYLKSMSILKGFKNI